MASSAGTSRVVRRKQLLSSMYFLSVALLLFICPAAAVLTEHFSGAGPLMPLVGKWFTFFAVGVRLFLAGIKQTLQPAFTAEKIFGVTSPDAHPIVREVGFGNLSMGAAGLLSLFLPGWLPVAAFTGGLYYGLAGIGHILNKAHTTKEAVALWSDVWIFLVLAAFVISRLV
jgi:hypothetical protein